MPQQEYGDEENLKSSGTIYYRLKIVDMQGENSYSSIRTIRLGEDQPRLSISTYLNPVTSELQITVPSAWQNGDVTYELYNNGGSLIKRVNNHNSNQTENMQLNELSREFI